MKLETGYVYHIKNEFFDLANDDKLMANHEGNATRPNYFCIKKANSDLMWFIPMSSKVEKYRKIIKNRIQKGKRCDTIVIGNYRNREQAFLIQNMFPITEKIHRPYRYSKWSSIKSCKKNSRRNNKESKYCV